MRFVNGRILMPTGWIAGGFEVQNGRFSAVGQERSSAPGDVDLRGRRVIPGLVDIHVHGAQGSDASDGSAEALSRMARYLAGRGVTAFAPTTVTLPEEALKRAVMAMRALASGPIPGASRMVGVHLEGPFLSKARCGAQNPAHLRTPDVDAFLRLNEACGGLVRLVDVAPELPGAIAFIREVCRDCTVSLAHTDADYDVARAAFGAGARHLTHLFNAMSPIHHRAPGAIGAASARDDVFAELICDGYHVHPAAVLMAFKLFPGRICLVSDGLSCMGMPEGDYALGGLPISVKGGVARLSDGTIAGAATDLYEDMRNAIRFGIDQVEAICAATINPARAIGADAEIGSIEVGKWADFVVCSEDLAPEAVYIGGATAAS